MTTADRGFIQFLGSDFGFWLLGSSDRGSQRFPGNLTFSIFFRYRRWLHKYFVDSHPQR